LATEKQAALKAANGHKAVRPPVERINHVLRGEVIDIYLKHVPAFKGMDRAKVYDMVMSNAALAAECYSIFTNRPDLFKHLLVDKDGAAVADEKTKLSCGRTLADITAMIVRAVAKRHFLKRFKPVPATQPEPPKMSIGDRVVYLFKKPPPVPKVKRKATRGDSLYRALRNYLLYHWQLPLIPHYTPLPVSVVKQLGAKILDYRTPGALKILLKEGPPKEDAAEGAAPVTEESAGMPFIRAEVPRQANTETVGQAKVEAMWTVAKAMKLTDVFNVEESELRRMVMHAAVTSGNVISSMSTNGMSMRNLVVMLCSFERQFGKARMPLLFGPQAKPAFIEALGALVKTHGIGELQHPDDIKNRVDVVIRQMQRNNQLPR
jgi:hypothetical protein